jgi:iron(III) transport system substrate-binding protein
LVFGHVVTRPVVKGDHVMHVSSIFGLILAGLMMVGPPAHAQGQVNLYSSRQENLIRPLLDMFSAETGIAVNLVSGSDDAIIERLRIEGINSPADLLLTADAARLYRAKELGVLQAVESDVLSAAIPEAYRDPDGRWFGLSLRARVMMYAPGRVDAEELSTYEALAEPQWRRRLCVRSSGSIYNQSLTAAMIAHQGVQATEEWARGLVANFARPPAGGDRDQIMAVAAGQCDVALVNTYYLGGMLRSDDRAQREAAGNVTIFWPNQEGRGAHVNVSGAGVTRAARNRDNAVRLLEFLVGDEAQRWYADVNNEYPVRPGTEWSPMLESWGAFEADSLNLDALGKHNAEAVRVMDRAGWR